LKQEQSVAKKILKIKIVRTKSSVVSQVRSALQPLTLLKASRNNKKNGLSRATCKNCIEKPFVSVCLCECGASFKKQTTSNVVSHNKVKFGEKTIHHSPSVSSVSRGPANVRSDIVVSINKRNLNKNRKFWASDFKNPENL
jgi:hypothetical protein